MADVRVRVITEQVGGDVPQKFTREMENMKRAADNTSKSGQSMGQMFSTAVKAIGTFTAAAGIAGYTLSKVYGQIKEGAALELAASRFDKLAASIGTTAEVLDNELDKATKGMMSQAERMSSASQIISLGLADNQKDVVDLATLVSELGWDMSQVILTFANNSKMRLDALGLSVTDVETRAKALEAQGYNMDKAFDLAVIQAGQAKLELLGSAADTTVGDLARAEASIEDFTNAIKIGLVPVLGGAAEGFNNFTSGLGAVKSAMESQWQTAVKNNLTYKEYIDSLGIVGQAIHTIGTITGANLEASLMEEQRIQGVIKATEKETDVIWANIDALTKQRSVLQDLDKETKVGKQGQYEFTEATYAWTDASLYAVQGMDMARDSVYQYKQGLIAAEAAQRDFEQALNDLNYTIAGPVGKEFESFTKSQADLEKQAQDLQKQMAELGATEFISPANLEAIGPLKTELFAIAEEIRALDEALEGGDLGPNKKLAAEDRLASLRQEAYLLEQQIKELGGLPYASPEQQAELEALREKYGEVQAAIDENAKAHALATKQIIFDLVSQQIAMSDLPFDQQLASINALAEQWGLVDSATKTAMDESAAALADFLATGDLEAFLMKLDAIRLAAQGIAGDYDIRFNIYTTGNFPGSTGGGTAGQGGQGSESGGTTGYGDYQTGGIIPGAFSQPRVINAHGGELVANPTQQARLLEAVMNGGSAPAGGMGTIVQVYLDSQQIAARVREVQNKDTRLKNKAGYGYTGA